MASINDVGDCCVCIGNHTGYGIGGASYCIVIGAGNTVRVPGKDGQINIWGLQFTSLPIAKALHAILHPTIAWLVRRPWGEAIVRLIGHA